MKTIPQNCSDATGFWARFRSEIHVDKFGCIHPSSARKLIAKEIGAIGVMDILLWQKANRTRTKREINKALKPLGFRLRKNQQPTGYLKAERVTLSDGASERGTTG